MKATGIVLFEFDDNEETLITFIYPTASKEMKTVILETAQLLINSNQSTLYLSFEGKYLYFQTKRNTNRSSDIRLYGLCLFADNIYPALYSELGQVLLEIYHDKQDPPRVLRSFLATLTDGQFTYSGQEFSIENFEEDVFQKLNFSPLLDRATNVIPAIWQALVTGKTVGVYSGDITILQQCAVPILALAAPGTRALLPVVLESSSTMTDAAADTKYSIYCSIDASILNNRFDLCVNLSQKSIVATPAFQKELTSPQLAMLTEKISDTLTVDGSVYQAIVEFNTEIISTLQAIKERLGDINTATISSVNLPVETKTLLSGIASAGILPI